MRNKIALFISRDIISVRGKEVSRPPVDTIPGRKGRAYLLHNLTQPTLEKLESLTGLQRASWDIVVVRIPKYASDGAHVIPELAAANIFLGADYPGDHVVYVPDEPSPELREFLEEYHPGSHVLEADDFGDLILHFLDTGEL